MADQELDVQEFSFPLPKAQHLVLHGHMTLLKTCTLLFLTTRDIGDGSGASMASLGSFVYAMPETQLGSQANTISTQLYVSSSSIDYAKRTANILARTTGLPAYVGCSVNFSGLAIEEEMEGLSKLIDVVNARHNQR